MRITIEPTEEGSIDIYSTVAISAPNDDLELYDFWKQLIEPAIIAMTYHPDSLKKVILELAEEIEDSQHPLITRNFN